MSKCFMILCVVSFIIACMLLLQVTEFTAEEVDMKTGVDLKHFFNETLHVLWNLPKNKTKYSYKFAGPDWKSIEPDW